MHSKWPNKGMNVHLKIVKRVKLDHFLNIEKMHKWFVLCFGLLYTSLVVLVCIYGIYHSFDCLFMVIERKVECFISKIYFGCGPVRDFDWTIVNVTDMNEGNWRKFPCEKKILNGLIWLWMALADGKYHQSNFNK